MYLVILTLRVICVRTCACACVCVFVLLGGMWSVVTPVPAGTHEFKFVVDGEWKHSTRHPTVGENDETTNNIRVIRGPPKNKQNTARLSEQRNKDAGLSTNKNKKCCVVS